MKVEHGVLSDIEVLTAVSLVQKSANGKHHHHLQPSLYKYQKGKQTGSFKAILFSKNKSENPYVSRKEFQHKFHSQEKDSQY